MVQDNREINKLLEEEIFVPNTLAEIVERVGAENPTVFSSIDLRSAYQQIMIDDGPSRDYCAFVSHMGQFRFTRLSYGMQAAPAKFMLLMSMVIGTDPMLQRNCIPYLDDILLFSKNLDEHAELLRRLFNALRKANLRIHPGKCEFLQQAVKYVGHIFSDKGIAPDPKKLSAILDFPRPTNKKSLKGFLGMNSFYRAYHKDLAKKVTPLLKLLRKDQRFVWTTECEEAFQDVRRGLRSMSPLAYADEDVGAGRYIIQVDASNLAIAGTLSQVTRDGKEERLLQCYGRSLRGSEINWATSDKEGAALMLALLRWKHLILGNPGLEIRSDNMSVTFLERIKHATSPRLARWSTAMSPLLTKATWTHVPGTKNVVPDVLSRQDYPPEDPIEGEEDLLYDDMTFAVIQQETPGECVDGECIHKESAQEYSQLLDYWKLSQESLDGVKSDSQVWDTVSDFVEHPVESEGDEVWIYQGGGDRLMYLGVDEEVVLRTLQEKVMDSIDEIGVKNERNELSGAGGDSKEVAPVEAMIQEIYNIDSEATVEESEQRIGVEICAPRGGGLRELQQNCLELGPLLKYLENGDLSESNSKDTRRILNLAEWHFLDEDGVLCSTPPRMTSKLNSEDQTYRVVPKTLRKEIMEGFHQFGHPGINRLLGMILKAGFRWERIYGDVRNFVLSCRACSTSKRGVLTPKAPLKPLPIPETPGEVLQIDILGPYTPSEKGHIAILSVIDRLTSYTWLFPLKACTSEIIANKLFKVFADIGLPKILISDNAANLVSKVMQDMAERLGIKRVNVAAYHSQSNGKIERTHRTIQDNLRALLNGENYRSWHTKVTEILWGLRSAVSATTKRSPYELRHGLQMSLPVERTLEASRKVALEDASMQEKSEYAQRLEERIKTLHQAHKIALEEQQGEMKDRYDESIRKRHGYRAGELVYLKIPVATPGVSRKLQPEYYGDVYEIIEILNEHNVRLKNTSTHAELQQVVHVDRLKPVVQRKDLTATTVVSQRECTMEQNGGTYSGKEQEQGTSDHEEAETVKDRVGREKGPPIVQSRIVQQKGSGDRKRFRIQWKNAEGKSNSYWSNLDNVPDDLLREWQRTHGNTGKTLKEFRRTRRN